MKVDLLLGLFINDSDNFMLVVYSYDCSSQVR